MKITTKKLLLTSLLSFGLGFGILALIRFKAANTPCYDGCTDLDFLRQWIAPVGFFLFVLSPVLIVASIVAKLGTPKRQGIASVLLMIAGGVISLLSQWKLSNLSSYYDRDDVALYGTLISPLGGLLFLLGATVLYRLVLQSKKSLVDDEHNIRLG